MEIQPIFRRIQTGSRQRALMLPAANRPFDQPGTLEDLYVLADCRLADLVWGGELANRRTTLREPRQDATAGAV